jgi:hypothetical protein
MGIQRKELFASLSIVAAFGSVAVLTGSAGAKDTVPGPNDLARGSGKLLLPTIFGPLPAHLVTSAKSEPGGVNPRGHFRTTVDATSIGLGPREVIAGIVTCLNVQDTGVQKTAVIGGMITSSTQPVIIPPGSGTIAEHVDNGPPPGRSPPDTVEATATGGTPPHACPPSFTGLFGQKPLEKGNWEIRKAGV